MFGVDGEDEAKEKGALIKYGWLYSIYSLPNIVLPFFGGFFVDKIGVGTALVIFASFLVIG
jgi:MFS family permease